MVLTLVLSLPLTVSVLDPRLEGVAAAFFSSLSEPSADSHFPSDETEASQIEARTIDPTGRTNPAGRPRVGQRRRTPIPRCR